MKLGVLCTSLSRRNGGVSEAARRLSQEIALQNRGPVKVLGSWDEAYASDAAGWEPLETEVLRCRGPRSFGFASGYRRALTALDCDLAHVHGLWSYPGIAARFWARRTGRPYIVSVHGMLDAWALANSGWKKRIAAALFERENLRRAACLHAITPQEVDAIRQFGLTNPVCLIPNGVDLPSETPAPPPSWRAQANGRKALLYLGRIHPKKGLLQLIEGWGEAVRKRPELAREWILVMAGWDQGGFEPKLRSRAAELSLGRDVIFAGPQFGADRAAAYSHASAFILPSFSEGLPLVVLEAWAHRLPVIMTDECCLPIGFTSEAALRVEPSAPSVATGLLALQELSESARSEMGARGRALVESSFTWRAAAASMRSVYGWLLGENERPTCVL